MKIFGYYIQKYDSEKIIDELAKIRIEIGGLKYRLSQLESRPTKRSQKPDHYERPEPVIRIAISRRITLDFSLIANIQ